MNLDVFNYNCGKLTGSNRLAELEQENCQFQCKIEISSNYNCNSLVNIMPFTFSFKRKKTPDTKKTRLKHIFHTAQIFSVKFSGIRRTEGFIFKKAEVVSKTLSEHRARTWIFYPFPTHELLSSCKTFPGVPQKPQTSTRVHNPPTLQHFVLS